jgi:anti-sigma factor RsiW
LALFVAESVTGWFAKDLEKVTAAPQQFTSHAVAAHRVYTKENRHAVEVVAAQEKHLVKWLSKRLGQKIKAPALGGFGYELVGGRLLAPVENVPAVHFMYQNEKLNRLTLYVRRAEKSETTSFRFERKGSVTMFYWIDSPMAYALIGEVPRAQLLEISNKVYDQISR